MKTLIFYRPNSDHERLVVDYLRDFKMQTGKDVPTMDVDTPEGIQLCELYGIVQYPAVLVTDNDGHVQNLWTGTSLPRIGELSYYVTDGGMQSRTHGKIIKAPNDRN
ncbi:MAG TPA: hypothetical protein VLA88_05310 [Candidatus Saccharimonadales bacterium]|nr:hypothetical protein [Candidatus Saccharimonadales bacterium]